VRVTPKVMNYTTSGVIFYLQAEIKSSTCTPKHTHKPMQQNSCQRYFTLPACCESFSCKGKQCGCTLYQMTLSCVCKCMGGTIQSSRYSKVHFVKRTQWRDSSSLNIVLHHTLHIWHRSKWVTHLWNSPHLPKFRPGHLRLPGTLGGDKGLNNENNLAVQEAECYMVVQWWNGLLLQQHNQDGTGTTQIQWL
jgi:hypothetical protein